MNFSIRNEELASMNEAENFAFPKYTSQLINWANQNAQGTRPAVVGQMSELFPEFMASGNDITVDSWKAWYAQKYPEAIDKATEKIYGSSTVCAVTEQKNRKSSATELKKTGIAPIVYRPRKTIGGMQCRSIFTIHSGCADFNRKV